jgi:hypothetical protein
LWYEHRKTVILALGFTQLVFDHCLFFKAHIIVAWYSDVCGIAFSVKEHLDALISGLHNRQ